MARRPRVNRGGSRTNHGKLAKIPQKKPARGASFIPYAQYLQERLAGMAAAAAAREAAAQQ